MSRFSNAAAGLLACTVSALLGGAAPAAASFVPAATPTAVRPAAADPNATLTAPVVTNGFVQPTGVYSAKDGSSRLFVLEKAGRVRSYNQATGARSTYLDLRGRIGTEGERGLLGIAFNPTFRTNPFVYVAYTSFNGNLQVVRYRPFAANHFNNLDPRTATLVLTVPHPPSATNHNAGHLAFGTDGLLYISSGDGGSTPERAQQVTNLSGKILRIDPRRSCSGRQYCIPPGNPFYNSSAGLQQIWLWGLRNPYQFSIDDNGEVWIGDVGQSTYEEIDVVQQNASGGNLGWSCMEAIRVYDASRCFPATRIPPYSYYGRALGNSVTGGRVYHGTRFPALAGLYVFGDFGTGRVFLIDRANGRRYDKGIKLDGVTGFGESDARELYAVTIDGSLHQIKAQ